VQGPPLKVIKMYTLENRLLHGSSFAISLNEIEFITWRKNEDTGDYWVKFHTPSGKEIRIKVKEEELRDIVDVWFCKNVNLKIGDDYELDY
jgi:hypothetical protein